MVKHLPHISIEKYAAYLDGNLPDEEMQQMKAFIDTDADMQAVLEADSNIGDDLDLDLLENEPIPCEMDLQSLDLPSLDSGLPFEENSVIEDFFLFDGDRSWEETESILYDGFNHQEYLDEIENMNDNMEIEDNPIGLVANEDVCSLTPDTPYNWGIHDGDYGYLELGLPPIITQDDLINNNDLINNDDLSIPSLDDNL
jgi:hypothetical protein